MLVDGLLVCIVRGSSQSRTYVCYIWFEISRSLTLETNVNVTVPDSRGCHRAAYGTKLVGSRLRHSRGEFMKVVTLSQWMSFKAWLYSAGFRSCLIHDMASNRCWLGCYWRKQLSRKCLLNIIANHSVVEGSEKSWWDFWLLLNKSYQFHYLPSVSSNLESSRSERISVAVFMNIPQSLKITCGPRRAFENQQIRSKPYVQRELIAELRHELIVNVYPLREHTM